MVPLHSIKASGQDTSLRNEAKSAKQEEGNYWISLVEVVVNLLVIDTL